jgi:hypothetical protein
VCCALPLDLCLEVYHICLTARDGTLSDWHDGKGVYQNLVTDASVEYPIFCIWYCCESVIVKCLLCIYGVYMKSINRAFMRV